jgi:hypothetical protein
MGSSARVCPRSLEDPQGFQKPWGSYTYSQKKRGLAKRPTLELTISSGAERTDERPKYNLDGKAINRTLAAAAQCTAQRTQTQRPNS